MDGYLLDISHIDPLQKWAMVCAVVLTILYVVMRPFKKRKDPLAHPTSLSLSGQRQMEKQMTELLVELEQMARQMTAQIETRAAKLQLLIREADEKLAALSAATAEGTMRAPAQEIAPPPFAPSPRHAEVYDLADQGRTSRQIAQQLGRPNGEVELILALRGHANAHA